MKGPSVEQVWISFTHKYIVLSFVVIDPLILEKKFFKFFVNLVLLFLYFLSLGRDEALYLNKGKTT